MAFLHDPQPALRGEPGTSLDQPGVALLNAAVSRLLGRGGAAIWCEPAGSRSDFPSIVAYSLRRVRSMPLEIVGQGRPRVPEHVVHRDFQEETVVLNLETGQYYGLNPTARRIFAALIESGSIALAATALEGSSKCHELESSVTWLTFVTRSLPGDCCSLMTRKQPEPASVFHYRTFAVPLRSSFPLPGLAPTPADSKPYPRSRRRVPRSSA
jgi:hypothetical protein